MEKSNRDKLRTLKTIVVTGPESTGKTLISAYLAEQMNCPWVPEYARDYIGSLQRPYTYEDLIHISDTQVKTFNTISQNKPSFLILDTWLIITKIWFLEVYGKYPPIIDKEIASHKIDLYIVCKPDIPWIPDPLRENGGIKRDYLMSRYLEEIRKTGSNFTEIGGKANLRYTNAMKAVKGQFNLAL